jgi:predicted RNA-binding Zn-ribbon protein involved in translation (DUF1610 family)
MSLINCSSCKKEISTEVVNCPHCGHPLKAKEASGNGCLWVIAISLLGVYEILQFYFD